MIKDRLSYLLELKDDLNGLINKRNIYVLATVVGGIYLGRRAYKYWRKHGIKLPWQLKEE